MKRRKQTTTIQSLAFLVVISLFFTQISTAVVAVDTSTPTPIPTVAPGVVDLGVNSESGLQEIRVNLPGMLESERALDMALVPSGQFTMGSPEIGFIVVENELPQHSVTISHSFYMSKYEMTEAQWNAILGELPSDYSSFGNDYPIQIVGWNQCQALIDTLNNLGFGYNFRFPTEAEWEYACRAGTTTLFYWGDEVTGSEYSLYAHTGSAYPITVGSKLPNAWQLFDMCGNVDEWCSDWYGLYSSEAQIDPRGPSTGNFHVYRGGAYWNINTDCRSAWRREWDTSQSEYPLGLRLVCENPAVATPIPTGTITSTPTITATPTPRPTLAPGVIDLGVNPDTDLQEIRIEISGLADGAKPLDMVHLPAIGQFTMGSPDTEIGRDSDEGPQHSVTISRPFYIGKYEITHAQWLALIGSVSGTYFPGNDYPVGYISWNECQQVINALNNLNAGLFRFATEAEWEYACRAGTTTRFYWGDDPGKKDWYDYVAYFSGYAEPVGGMLPNNWGLYDMSGNANEWCGDWFGAYTADWQIDPQGPSTGTSRVLRSGITYYGIEDCRSAARNDFPPVYDYPLSGLRVVREDHTSPTPIPTNYPTVTPTPIPTHPGGISGLGVNPDTGLEEIRVNLPGMLTEALPFDMVLIPAGDFIMGSPETESGRNPVEGPQHVVTISRPFYIGKYVVTEAQWLSVMDSLPSSLEMGFNNRPIHEVEWNDCKDFADELSSLGFGMFRLPTEAEWEYACRAGTNTMYYWGNDPYDPDTNTDALLYAWVQESGAYFHPDAGLLLPNAWGLYDMSGNVYEWCSNWYSDYSAVPQLDPQGPDLGDYKIMRGGDFETHVCVTRSAMRLLSLPYDTHYYNVGLRLVRDDPTSPTPIATRTPLASDTATPTPTATPSSTPTPTPTTDPSRPDFDAPGAVFGAVTDIPVALAHGDVDLDGDEDLVMGNGDGLQSQLYLNDGAGAFTQSTSVQLLAHAGVTTSLAIGDVNGDSNLDIVMGVYEGPKVVFLGDGSGGFGGSPASELEFGVADDMTWSIALGDMNGDSVLDAVAGNCQQRHCVYLGDGTGAFGGSAGTEILFGQACPGTVTFKLGDVDGDGDLDAAVAPIRGQGTVYLNDGTGALGGSAAMELPFGTSESHIASLGLADADGDSDLDLVAASWYIYDFNYVYLNDGQGNFGGDPSMETAFGNDADSAWTVDLCDVDGDGGLDAACGAMIYTPLDGQQNVIYLNNGYGTLGGGVWNEIAVGDGGGRTRCVLFVDVDGDGDQDLAAANLYQSARVYLNSGPGN